jgi:glycosyltransferase involved in cell wall biosynthesis
MTDILRTVPVCLENRMIVAAGTGVSTYARALRSAQRAIASHALMLSGGTLSAPGSPQSFRDRLQRNLQAISPGAKRVRPDATGFCKQNIFRLGFSYYALHGRPMPVRVPGPAGIMHWSYPVPLRLEGWRNIYTVHDVIPLTDPELSSIDAARHRRLLERLADVADTFVTVSRFAARTIAQELHLPPALIVDCAQPVDVGDARAGATALPANLRTRDYLLVCGTVEPRKNIARILAAYRTSAVQSPLVIVGPDGSDGGDLPELIRNTPGVVRLPYQDRTTVLALLAHARALVMPSLAEGFGLPVAEAMTFGTPVITSSMGALAETAADGALLVDPLDTAALADAMVAIERDAALRARLSAAGLRRAEAFRPASFAQRLRALYEGLLETP